MAVSGDKNETASEIQALAEQKMTKAKLSLVGIGAAVQVTSATAAFFASLCYRMKYEQATMLVIGDILSGKAELMPLPTAATDGRYIIYNPKFWLSCTDEERIGVLVHELMHCAMMHHHRLKFVPARKRQIACDLAINTPIIDAGFKLPTPDDLCIAGKGKFHNFPEYLSAEEYVRLLTDDFMDKLSKSGKKKGQGQGGQQQGDGSGSGEGMGEGGDVGTVLMPEQRPGQQHGEDGEELTETFGGTEKEWKDAVAEAAQIAKQRGDVSAGIGRLIDQFLATPKLDWATILAQFLTTHCRDDYSWHRMNKRAMHGIVLPVLHSDRPGHLVVAIDTSGSIDQPTIKKFWHEVRGIMDCLPVKVSIIWCDCRVHSIQEWVPTDGDLKPMPAGGGGTDHRPVFTAIDKLSEPPVAVVCLTDMETRFPDYVPDYPVLWISTNERDIQGPFGQTIRL